MLEHCVAGADPGKIKVVTVYRQHERRRRELLKMGVVWGGGGGGGDPRVCSSKKPFFSFCLPEVTYFPRMRIMSSIQISILYK